MFYLYMLVYDIDPLPFGDAVVMLVVVDVVVDGCVVVRGLEVVDCVVVVADVVDGCVVG